MASCCEPLSSTRLWPSPVFPSGSSADGDLEDAQCRISLLGRNPGSALAPKTHMILEDRRVSGTMTWAHPGAGITGSCWLLRDSGQSASSHQACTWEGDPARSGAVRECSQAVLVGAVGRE